jgi:pyruvate/2-oxoglutarate dehydrogenase complex dihydrolipoamide dehydrogenase (E3) component
LRQDGIELALGVQASAARREGEHYALELDDGRKLSGDRLLVATGRRPRVDGLGLETVGVEANGRGIPVDARLSAGERLWAIGDVNGIWQKTATYTRASDASNGFVTLLSDGERLTGAYALGPEAGEWLQQATLAIRARVPLAVLRDTIQPFPTFSEIYIAALKALHGQITTLAR